MKTYPSIPSDLKNPFWGHVFTKFDGSNIRVEWDAKTGWGRIGSRTQIINKDTEILGGAVELFNRGDINLHLDDIARKDGWKSAVFFFEFWGPNSFAGMHDLNDDKYLTLIDVSVYNKGLIAPVRFVELFANDWYCANYLGEHYINQDFLDNFEQKLGFDFKEGIVAKGTKGSGTQRMMVKAKTPEWKRAVREKFPEAANKKTAGFSYPEVFE